MLLKIRLYGVDLAQATGSPARPRGDGRRLSTGSILR
jgi:hypothetical protein